MIQKNSRKIRDFEFNPLKRVKLLNNKFEVSQISDFDFKKYYCDKFWKKTFIVSKLKANFPQGVRFDKKIKQSDFENEQIRNVTYFEFKHLQCVSYRRKIFSFFQSLMQNYLRCVRYWIEKNRSVRFLVSKNCETSIFAFKLLERVRIWKVNSFATCQNLKFISSQCQFLDWQNRMVGFWDEKLTLLRL